MSLLLDALKQAEKSKNKTSVTPENSSSNEEKTEINLSSDELSLESTDSFDDPATKTHEATEVHNSYTDSASHRVQEDTQSSGPRKGYSGELRLSNEESQSLSIDLDQFVEELQGANEPAHIESLFDDPDTTQSNVVGQDSMTMPSMKSVQKSMNDFYGEPTNALSKPEKPLLDEDTLTSLDSSVSLNAGGSGAHTAGGSTSSQHAAKNVFTAKSKSHSSRTIWLSAVAVLIAVFMAGGYFWLDSGSSYQTKPPPMVRIDRPVETIPSTIASTQPEVSPASRKIEIDDKVKEAMEELRLAKEVSDSEKAAQNAGSDKVEELVQETERVSPVDLTKNIQQPPSFPEKYPVDENVSSKAQPAAPISIKRRSKTDRNFKTLGTAYDAYISGDYEKARQSYERVLRNKPDNRNALKGMAALAIHQNEDAKALQYYERILQLDPQDSVARAALISINGQGSVLDAQSQIKTLIQTRPNAAYLHFTLGNLYASQAQWAQAQTSYFNAWNIHPTNADYAFNVAVALDHLEQYPAAKIFYQKALALAENMSINFNAQAVSNRLIEISKTGIASL